MRYIDKYSHLREGNDVTDHYLETVCRVNDGDGNYHYQNVDYDGSFTSTDAKSEMRRLAMVSQDNLCCYCMRDLHMQNQRITLEHIIPQHASQAEYNGYTGINLPPLTAATVIRTDDFVGVPNQICPPRPHTVTFENLVASCDGTFPETEGCPQCCNHSRGEKHVYPIFFVEGVEKEITYMEDGTMQPVAGCAQQAEYRQTIENARLNCQNLKDIRKLWHLFAEVEFEVLIECIKDMNLRTKTLMKVLFNKEEQSESDSKILNKFMKDDYWKTFLLYHWFHHRI